MNTIAKYLLLTIHLIFGLPTHSAFAQYQSLRFDRITVEDGLPNPSVMDIIQDSQGFMWFGTLSGIVRYDGYEMKTYLLSASLQDSLPTRNIPNFYQDKSGNIWVGFQYEDIWPKLYRYDATADIFIPCLYDPGREENPIRRGISTIREDRRGRLLVGTWGDGLYAIDIKKEREGIAPKDLPFQQFLHNSAGSTSLGNNVVGKGWGEDSEGNFWLPTDDGLCKFTPGEDHFETFRFTTDTIPLANEFGVVFFEKPNTLWVGSAIHGLLVFNTKEKKFVKQYPHVPTDPFSIAPNAVWKIIKTRDGKFWLGVNGRMDIFDPTTGLFTHIKNDDQDTWEENFYWNNALIEDYSGNIWTATWQQGIYKYNPGKGRFYFLRPGEGELSGIKNLSAEYEDRNGHIWLGSEGHGLIRWNRENNTFRRYRHQPGNPNSLSSDLIASVSQDNDGNLWIGTGMALDRMDANGNIRHYHPFPEGNFSNVWISKKGQIWVSSFNAEPGLCKLVDAGKGIFKYYPDQMKYTGAISGLSTIEEDEQGRLWLGVNQWGFYIFDPQTEKFEHLALEFGFHDIHFDRFGNTWMATHSAGLKLWDPGRKEIVQLPKAESDKIRIPRGILEDAHGFLWMKTPEGLVKFNPRTRKVVRQFSTSNWMGKEKRWYGGRNGFKTRSGEMFFNSPSGVLYFHPDSLLTDAIPPKVALTEFRLFNEIIQPGDGGPLKQSILQTKKIELGHPQNDITLIFAALHFKSPPENAYQYMLENYDQDWHSASTERTANYTNLNPGHYIFRVKAANSDGVWSAETTLEIVIHNPWWRTWWAILFFIGLFLLALYGIRNYELRRQRAKAEAERLAELDAVKSKLYTNITHEFRTPLTIILGVVEQLKAQASEGMKPGLEMIQRNGRQLLGFVTQILDLSKLESGFLKLDMKQGDVVRYLQYLTESFHSFAKEKNVKVQFVCEMKNLVMDFDPKQLQQIVSNLISNALKFTPAGGSVTVSVGKSGERMELRVSDSGIGISKENLPKIFDRFYQAGDSTHRTDGGTGIGLALTHELVKLMNGEISVSSELGKGTDFVVLLPVKNEGELISSSQFEKLEPTADAPSAKRKKNRQPAKRSPANAPLVLIVEDNDDVVAYIHSCLEQKYRIAIARDGQEGIDRALELIPDLIVSDVMMPEKDGFEVCRFLKTDERTSHIPVILLTAKADDASRLSGLIGGADAYLAKPFNPEELLIRAKKLIELRKNLRAHYRRIAGFNAQTDGIKVSTPEPTSDEVFVKKVREIIHANLDNSNYAVPDLLKALNMSRTQLHRKLTSLTGHSANRFIRLVRLTKAKQMMRDTELNISEISYQTGFSTPDYFSKVFRKETGMTPGEYRSNG